MGINIFHRGDEFYHRLKKEIVQARTEILINVYSFHDDKIGKRFITILKRKACEGVTVRVSRAVISFRRAALCTIFMP